MKTDKLFLLGERAAAGRVRGIFALALAVLLSAPRAALAKSPGTTAFNFLKIGAGARQMAMANNAVATDGDVNSSAYNPAALANLSQQEVGFLHTEWLEDITYQYAAYAYPHARYGTFAVGLHRLSFGTIEGYDRNDVRTANPKASDLAVGFTYARSIGRDLSLGLTARHIREDLAVATAKAFAFDLGAIYRTPGEDWWSRFDYGLAVRNFGTKAKFIQESSPLPLQVDGGIAYRDWNDRIHASVEAHKPDDGDLYLSFGGEVSVRNAFHLRAGYRTGRDIGPGFTLGAGMEFLDENLSLDYAFVPFEEFGNVHRVGMVYRFGGAVAKSFKKGVKLMRTGRCAEAILEFDRVLQKDPRHALAARYMKYCAQKIQEVEEP